MSTGGAESRLVGLAFIGALFDAEDKSYGDLLGSIVIRELADHVGGATAPELSSGISVRLGMEVPSATVASALSRKSVSNVVEQHGSTYHYTGKALPKVAVDRAAIVRQEANLVANLQEFAFGSFDEQWSVADATSALNTIIDRHAPALSQARPVPATTGDIPVVDRARAVIAAAWINLVLEKDPTRAEFLFTLVKGRVIGAALVDSRRGEYQHRFRKTTVYLDTPEVLSVLGYHGGPDKNALRAGLRVATAAGARIACLESTVTEVRNVILQAQYGPGVQRFRGPSRVQRHFAEAGVSSIQVREHADQLENDIRRRGIKVDQGESWDPSGVVDEELLREKLRISVHGPAQGGNSHGFDRGSAVDFDARALLSVFSARERMGGDRLETSRAILLTSNSRLVRAANGLDGFRSSGFGVCIGLHDFLNLMWLRSPAHFTEMPAGRLAMECAAMLTPSPEVWAQYSTHLAALEAEGEVSADTVAIALYSAEARQRVALSQARGESFDGSSVRLTVDRIEEARNAAYELERTAKLEAARERDQLLEEKAALQGQLQDEGSAKLEALGSLSVQAQRNETSRSRVKQFSIGVGRVVVSIPVSLVALGLAWFTLLANPDVEQPWNWMGAVGIGVLAVLGVSQAWSTVALWVGRVIERSLLRSLSLDEP